MLHIYIYIYIYIVFLVSLFSFSSSKRVSAIFFPVDTFCWKFWKIFDSPFFASGCSSNSQADCFLLGNNFSLNVVRNNSDFGQKNIFSLISQHLVREKSSPKQIISYTSNFLAWKPLATL